MPAMLLTEPFGFAASSTLAARRPCSGRSTCRFASSRSSIVGRRVVVALAVRDRNPQHLARVRAARERRVGLLDADVDVLAAELEAAVAQHRARQQARLEQDLEAVADAEHRTAARGERLHRRHDRREARHRAGAQVVAVREAAGQDDDVGALQARVLVPDELGLLAEHVAAPRDSAS